MQRSPRTKGSPVNERARSGLRAYYERHGERATLAHFHMSRNAFYRAVAGLTVYPGTEALAELGLRASNPPPAMTG